MRQSGVLSLLVSLLVGLSFHFIQSFTFQFQLFSQVTALFRYRPVRPPEKIARKWKIENLKKEVRISSALKKLFKCELFIISSLIARRRLFHRLVLLTHNLHFFFTCGLEKQAAVHFGVGWASKYNPNQIKWNFHH
jgi:hypothetical protein